MLDPQPCWHRGNESADQIAKTAVAKPNVDLQIEPETTELKHKVDIFIRNKWQAQWSAEETGRTYFELEPKVSNTIKFQDHRRDFETAITRLRLRKCWLNAYLFRINRHPTGLSDHCYIEETVEHLVMNIMNCRNNSNLTRELKPECARHSISFHINKILSSKSMCETIYRYLKSISRRL